MGLLPNITQVRTVCGVRLSNLTKFIHIISIADSQKAPSDIIKEVIELVRSHVGAVAAFREALIVKRLPKTRSGKVARNTIADMVAGKQYKVRPNFFNFMFLGHFWSSPNVGIRNKNKNKFQCLA